MHRTRIGVVAVGLVGMLLVAFFVFGMVNAANPNCCAGKHPYVKLYDRERSQIEALLVTGDGQAFAALGQDPLLAHPEVIEADGEYAYRAQRPMWGYLAWAMSLGQPDTTGWALVGLSIIACGLACSAAGMLLAERNLSPWWALLVLVPAHETLSTLTPELLGFALLGGGVLLWEGKHRTAAVVALSGAVLTRESMAVGVLALAAWEIWSRREQIGFAIRRATPLAVPCLVYIAWVCVLRLRLGLWPVGSSETRLTLPGVGALDSFANAPSTGLTIGVVAAITLCITSITFAREDPLTWITVGFGIFATTFSQEVWTHAGFTRTLIPLYMSGFIATLGGMRRQRASSTVDDGAGLTLLPTP